jgi:uncharacterized membrane protein YeiH
MEEPEYLWICVLSAAGAFLAWPHLEERFNVRISDSWVEYLDALGVGAFCVIGAQNGIRAGVPCAAAVACGMFTATFGGVVRDVLMERPVRILHSYTDIYATTALGGATTYMLVRRMGLPVSTRIIAGFSVAVALRVAANKHDWRLPTYAGPLVNDAESDFRDTRFTARGLMKRNAKESRDGISHANERDAESETRKAPRVPSGAVAAARKGDDGSGARPKLAEAAAAAFRAFGV